MKKIAVVLILLSSISLHAKINGAGLDYHLSSNLKNKQFEGEILGVSCSAGMTGQVGTVEVRNIREIGLDDGSVISEEVQFKINRRTCENLLPKIGNCSKQYATFSVNDDRTIDGFEKIHTKPGMRICELI